MLYALESVLVPFVCDTMEIVNEVNFSREVTELQFAACWLLPNKNK